MRRCASEKDPAETVGTIGLATLLESVLDDGVSETCNAPAAT